MNATDDVSRETLDDLTHFHDILLKWNRKINLVSKSSAADIWNRHIWDSYQLAALAPPAPTWLDLGSGGGFPGVVVAIHAKHERQDQTISMVESDQRKCAFLRTAVRELGLNAQVHSARIELLAPQRADVVSARALADLAELLNFANRHLAFGGTALFLKGETWENEVEVARQTWSFEMRVHKSITNPKAAILEIKEIKRA